MIYSAILAGGSGTRLNISSMPKQFLPIADKPIIIHTLEKMLLCNRFDAIFVGVHGSYLSHMSDLLKKYNIDKKIVHIVNGGESRNDTIFNIIDKIDCTFTINDDDIIVTHDAVRPFVTLRILNDNINTALKYNACDTVINATDTIVCSTDDDIISEIPNRQHMYQGQTPQSFNIKMLKELYNSLTDKEKEILTDACKICVLKGQDVKLVKGEVSNIKITTVTDYKIAQVLAGGIAID